MDPLKSIQDLYREIDNLISCLENTKLGIDLANILKEKMYQIAWTTSSELLEELQKDLNDFLQFQENSLDQEIKDRISNILRFITEIFDYKKRNQTHEN